MSRRFYFPQSLEHPTIQLSGPEAHHLARVLRLTPGDEVTLFDGRGTEAQAQVAAIAPDCVELVVLGRTTNPEPDEPALTLATAVPKGERFDWLVEKATELGVARLVPLVTARSVVRPGDSKLERLRRTIVEASKQCGRSRLMELAAPLAWSDLLRHAADPGEIWVADPSGESPGAVIGETHRPALVAVGPEGGFTAEEVELATCHGARLIGLGPRILRVETAGIALVALSILSPVSVQRRSRRSL